jgi:hypothetical protein
MAFKMETTQVMPVTSTPVLANLSACGRVRGIVVWTWLGWPRLELPKEQARPWQLELAICPRRIVIRSKYPLQSRYDALRRAINFDGHNVLENREWPDVSGSQDAVSTSDPGLTLALTNAQLTEVAYC